MRIDSPALGHRVVVRKRMQCGHIIVAFTLRAERNDFHGLVERLVASSPT